MGQLRSLCICIPAIALLPISSAAQEVNNYRVFTITLNTSAPTRLAIDRGRLAWSDSDRTTGMHFVKYFSGADIVTLDSELSAVTLALGRDHVVWNTSGEIAKAYDLRTGTTDLLGESYNPDAVQPICADAGRAVYARRKVGTGSTIVLHRFVDGMDTMLSGATWNTEPSVDQGEVAWVASDSEAKTASSTILFFDGRSTSIISGTARGRGRWPCVRDGQVVWREVDSSGASVMCYTGDSLITLARWRGSDSVLTGYDLSDGVAIAGVTDTARSAGIIRIYTAEQKSMTTLSDSNGVWSPHISNGLVVWQSGTGPDRRIRSYDVHYASFADVTTGENPVLDHDIIAWTYGDAVELRRFVSYRQLTTDGMNGWEQTKFKTIDSNRVIWGNFSNALHMRMFAWDGNAVNRLSDSTGTRDLVMANDGYAIWRLDADSLFYSDWSHPPVKFLDSVQAENPYTAGGSISFFGVKLNQNDPVKYPWLFDIPHQRLTQLSTDSSNVGNVLCDGDTACWENLGSNQLLLHVGGTTTVISDSAISGDYVFRRGIIAWTEVRDGVAQVFVHDVSRTVTSQLTTGGGDKYRPLTDGTAIAWFENPVISATFVDADLVYLDQIGGVPCRLHHVPYRTTSWKWMSDGKIAWVADNNPVVFDGAVISPLYDGSGYLLNDAHVDKGFVEWRKMQSPPAADSGDIFLGTLQPHVAFDAGNIAGPVPLATAFVNRSWEDVRSYLWDFGDGSTSMEENPSHLYLQQGRYSVTLTVSGMSSQISERKYSLVHAMSATGVPGTPPATPIETKLFQNYPNPFNPTTVVSGQLTADSWMKLEVFDALGSKITTLADGRMHAGGFSFVFDGHGLATGVYFYRLEAGKYSATKAMLLIR